MERYSADELDGLIAHFSSLTWAALAVVGEALMEADRRQSFTADGSRDLTHWAAVRMSARHATASQLVRVARRLRDLPKLREQLAVGNLSLDQVAISKMATPTTEEGLIEECLGLSTAALDRAARRATPPTVEEERTAWERRHLGLQWNLDQSELRFDGTLPGAEGKLLETAVRERADRIPVNPETGMFDPYPCRLADGLVELSATSGGGNHAVPAQVTVFADLEALTEDTSTFGVAELMASPPIANETARRYVTGSSSAVSPTT